MELPVRTNPRASRYNYASSGVYFVTICTKDRKEYFGKIVEKKMVLNEIGRICEEELQMMLQKRPSVDMYEYVIMPNHVHLLLSIDDPSNYGRDGSCTRPNNIQNNICPNNTQNNTRSNITQNITHNPKSSGDDRTGMKPVPTTNMTTPVPMANITHQTLGSIVGLRKSAVYMKCDALGYPFARQSRYHDHIVRNEQEYDHIKHYIHINPKKRKHDTFRIEM